MRLKQGPGPGRDRSGLPARAERSALQLPFGGEDPLRWGLPVLRIGGLSVKFHAIVLFWVAAEMVAWLPRDSLGLIHAGSLVLGLLAASTLREVARMGLARWLDERDDDGLRVQSQEAMVWPLGGLTSAAPLGVRRTFLAELGGIGAGLLLMLPAAALVLLAGAPISTLLFDPMSPRVTAAELRSPAQVIAWWFYYANALVLVLNLLLPMLPFDLGRIVLALTRRRSGNLVAAAVVLRVGLVAALAVLVFASTTNQTRVIAVAAVGALATWLEYRRLTFMADPLSDGRDDAAPAVFMSPTRYPRQSSGAPDSTGKAPSPRPQGSRRQQPDANPRNDAASEAAPDARSGSIPPSPPVPPASPQPPGRAGDAPRSPAGAGASRGPGREGPSVSPSTPMNLDEVLAKISRGGLASLSDAEREFLSRETERRRGG